MRQWIVFVSAGVLCVGLAVGSMAASEPARSVGPGIGILDTDGTRDLPCAGNLFINGDQQYENGYGWHGDGEEPPYYGAFAECFVAPGENWVVCGGIFDLTVVYVEDCPHYTMDAYIWSDDEGIPGSVLAVVTGFDPYPISQWPHVSRHFVPLSVSVTGPFWVGEWGNWINTAGTCTWFIAADENGVAGGCPFTNYSPDVPWYGPAGWGPVTRVWPDAKAIGIGYYGHRSSGTSSAPEPAGEVGNWGRVKALYR